MTNDVIDARLTDIGTAWRDRRIPAPFVGMTFEHMCDLYEMSGMDAPTAYSMACGVFIADE